MSVTASLHGLAARRGIPTAPSVRSSFGNSTGNGSSVAGTIPAGVQNGDIGIVTCTSDGASLFNTPSGWTLIDWNYDQGSSGQIVVGVYKKLLTTADASTTVTVARTSGTNSVMCLSGVVVKDGSDMGIALRLGRDPLATNPNGQTVRLGAVRPGPQDLVLALGGARGYLSTALTAPKISTQPSGFTIHENRSVQNNVLAIAYASWICSGSASNANGTALTALLGDQSYRLGGMLTISPAGRRPTAKLPSSLIGAAIHGYGTSYLGFTSDAYAHPSEQIWYDRVARQMGTPSENNNMGTPGAMATDVCGFAYGTVSYSTRAVNADTGFKVTQAGTWLSQPTRSGLVLCDLFGNDGLQHRNTASSGTTAKRLAGARNAGDAFIRLIRASSMKMYNDASIAYSAGWSNFSNTDYGGGTAKGTTTPGATVTITTTQTDIDLVLFAIDNANLTQTGASYSVTVNGSAFASGTTSDQMQKGGDSSFKQSAYCQMCVPVRGMPAGTNTIVITHTGASGTGLYFNGYLLPAGTPPWIVLNKLAHYSSSLYSALGYGGGDSDMDLYSQIAVDIAAQFPDGRVLLFDPLESGLWDYTTMVTSYDNVHLNDVGSAFYARGIAKLLQERVA